MRDHPRPDGAATANDVQEDSMKNDVRTERSDADAIPGAAHLRTAADAEQERADDDGMTGSGLHDATEARSPKDDETPSRDAPLAPAAPSAEGGAARGRRGAHPT